MFRKEQNRYIFGQELNDKENVFFRHFGSLYNESEAVTVDLIIHNESDMEIRINDEPLEI